MKKILVVLGTRPEVVKLAPVVHECRRRPDRFQVVLCTTGQHQEMLDPLLTWFDLQPDVDLALMRHGQSLGDLTAGVLAALMPLLVSQAPDLVLVQGDTTTAMAASMAAFYSRVDVGHVEAGLRTGDLAGPFPEEFNRRVVGIVARHHFAPTPHAGDRLRREGVAEERICVTGNTVIDALLASVPKVLARETTYQREGELRRVDFGRRIILVTAHRRESFGSDFVAMCEAVVQLAARFPDYEFVYPVHLNPQVQSPARTILDGLDNVKLISPLGYDAFLFLLMRAHLVLTDSGGVQEEAPSLGKPVLVMRNRTERPEGIEAGVARLVGTDRESIVTQVAALCENDALYTGMSRRLNPYGDGSASARIAAVLTGDPWEPFAPRSGA